MGENSNLERLYIQYNKITHFDLGTNKSLKTLNLENNSLNSFTMGENSSLENLWINNNKITHFDLGTNKSLK